MTRWPIRFGFLLFLAVPAMAQQPTPPPPPPRPTPTVTVSLAQALDEAQRHSPTYRQTLNDAWGARWAVRNAYASLFLPTLTVGGNLGYTGSGSATFGGTFFNQSSPSLSSGYAVQLNWSLNGTTITGPAQQKANLRAVDEDINGAMVQLQYDVVSQYLTALQAIAQTDVARQQVARNMDFLSLAQARYQVGQATIIDVKQAQVQKGQADVALLRAQQAENEAKLELYRRMGVNVPAAVDQVGLSDSFPVTEPVWQLDQLMSIATEHNPTLRALRSRESAAGQAVAAQKSRYLPQLSFQAYWNGFTQQFTNENILLGSAFNQAQGTFNNCQFQNSLVRSLPGGGIGGTPGNGTVADCYTYSGLNTAGTALSPAIADQIRKSNNVFPFSFTRQPFNAVVQIQLPIFDGFTRNLNVAQAKAQRDDFAEQTRARELQVRTDVQARYLGLQTAYQAISVQLANRDAARDQLRLAQDRYRLGSGSALEVSDAQNAVQKAEGDYVNAVYDYHKAIAALEYAVGRPLR